MVPRSGMGDCLDSEVRRLKTFSLRIVKRREVTGDRDGLADLKLSLKKSGYLKTKSRDNQKKARLVVVTRREKRCFFLIIILIFVI